VFKFNGEIGLVFIRNLLFLLFAFSLFSCASDEAYQPDLTGVSTSSLSQVSVVRPADLLTVSQGVQLHVDGKFVDKIWHDETVSFDVVRGTHELETSVGLSLGVPNITGYNGARAYEINLQFNKEKYFFKIEFNPSLLVGQHILSEITEEEFNSLVNK
jgi:hypothetical protein